jgi:hypothetical protein
MGNCRIITAIPDTRINTLPVTRQVTKDDRFSLSVMHGCFHDSLDVCASLKLDGTVMHVDFGMNLLRRGIQACGHARAGTVGTR